MIIQQTMTTLERTLINALSAASYAGKGAYSLAKQAGRAARRARSGTGRPTRSRPLTLTRTSLPLPIVQTAGEANGAVTITLNQVQTTDLIGMYDEFKINWVKFRVQPRVDPGQSGITNNTQNWVAAACDVTGQISSPNFTTVTALDNHKVSQLTQREFIYTFTPRAINALQAGNLAINRNDWLILSTAGAAVAHQSLLYNIKSLNTSAVLAFDYLLEINFSARQAS